jgi:hypothetical protein
MSAVKTGLDSTGKQIVEIWGGSPGAPTLIMTLNTTSVTLGDGITLNGEISSTGENAAFLTVAASTSAQTPLVIAGNADAATARTGGNVRAPDVSGATTNVNGADLTVGGGVGHGSGTPGNVVVSCAPAASSGNNPQTRATVATFSSAGLTMAASKTITGATVIGGSAVGSDLTLQSTSGAGDGTDTVLIKVGNNGASTVATFAATAITLADAVNIAVNTTTGTKIGTAASQKLGFFGATPVIQQAGVAVTAEGIHAALVNLGLITA